MDDEALFSRATAAANDGQYLSAIEDLQTILSRDPCAVPIKANIACLYEMSGDLLAAREIYSQVIEIDPENAMYQRMFGDLLSELGEYENAEVHLKIAADLDDQDAFAPFYLARLYWKLNDLDEALGWAERAVSREGSSDESLYFLGLIRYELKDMPGAIEAFKRAHAIDPEYHDDVPGIVEDIKAGKVIRIKGQEDS